MDLVELFGRGRADTGSTQSSLASALMGWLLLSVAELVLGIVAYRTSYVSRYMRWSGRLMGWRDDGDLAWMNKLVGGVSIFIGALSLKGSLQELVF